MHDVSADANGIIAGFQGANIYFRCMMSLKCPIPEEQDWALTHLVRISHERGDKFRFKLFPGLNDSLLEYILKIGTLFYREDWTPIVTEWFTRSEEARHGLLQRTLDRLPHVPESQWMLVMGHMTSAEFEHQLNKINEAALVVRNMLFLKDNAEDLHNWPPLLDLLPILLNLPTSPLTAELKYDALEMAELIASYWPFMSANDPLYRSILAKVESPDRTMRLVSLRTLAQISRKHEQPFRFPDVPASCFEQVRVQLYVPDEELIRACMDFLYVYTYSIDKNDVILHRMDVYGLVRRLAELLCFGKREVLIHKPRVTSPEEAADVLTMVDKTEEWAGEEMPQALFDKIMTYEEPERTAHWWVPSPFSYKMKLITCE